MKTSLLDDLDIIVYGNTHERSQWIHDQTDKDFYEVGCWLMSHLTPNHSGRDHLRSDIRELLYKWDIQGNQWTERQKHYLGHSVIAFWPVRQQDQDPRYIF
jgi:hypothetical protein